MRDMRRIRNADAESFRADSPSDEYGKRYSLVCRLLRNVRPATFIATLRCKTVSEQVCHRLADALPAIKGKAVTASSRLFRSLRLLHNRQLAVLVYPPWPPKGKIIARERQCQRSRQCPESAYINIIPSGLCNSSLDRHLSARTTSICEGQWPATTVLQAAG